MTAHPIGLEISPSPEEKTSHEHTGSVGSAAAGATVETSHAFTAEEQRWIDWFKEENDRMVSSIPAEILKNEHVLDALAEIIKERLVSEFVYESEESYERSLLNSDIHEFINGKPIKFINKIITLKDGTKTDTVSLEWVREGRYNWDIRLVLRALIGILIESGSKGEKRDAVYFAKNIIEELGMSIGDDIPYEGADESTMGADAQHMVFQDRNADFYASGGDKPKGYLGRGFTRKNSRKYADQTSAEVKGMLFGGDEDALDLSGISKEYDYDKKKFKSKVTNYAGLNNTGQTRIDVMAEFSRTLLGDKVNSVINGFDGKDQNLLADIFRTYMLIDQTADAEQKRAGELMLGLSPDDNDKNVEAMKKHAASVYFEYMNGNLSYYMKQPLADAIANFAGIPAEKRRKFDGVEPD